MKFVILLFAGCGFFALGLLGLVLPIFPGFIFLLAAAACFASLSPKLREKLSKHPRLRRFFNRLESGAHLHWGTRIKLAFWASLEAVNPKQRHRW